MRRQKIRGIRRKRAGGDCREIRDRRMRNGDEVETGYTGEIRTEACVFSVGHVQQAADTRFAQVCVDEKGAVAELRERDGQICGGGSLAFTRQSTGDKNDLQRMIGLRKQESGSQRAKRFLHLRFWQMLRNELDALVVA